MQCPVSKLASAAPSATRTLDQEGAPVRRARGGKTRHHRPDPLLAVVVLVLMGIGGGGVFLANRSETTAAPTVTTRAALVTELRPFVETPQPGDTFTDPEGTFRMRISPGWERRPGDGRERWYVRSGSDRFRDAVSISAEQVATTTSLESFLSVAQDRARDGLTNYELISERRVTLASGGPGGLLVYEGDLNGVRLRVLTVVTLSANSAATATLVTQPERFDEVRAAVEPFLETLQAL
jgi:hypothetical protein